MVRRDREEQRGGETFPPPAEGVRKEGCGEEAEDSEDRRGKAQGDGSVPEGARRRPGEDRVERMVVVALVGRDDRRERRRHELRPELQLVEPERAIQARDAKGGAQGEDEPEDRLADKRPRGGTGPRRITQAGLAEPRPDASTTRSA